MSLTIQLTPRDAFQLAFAFRGVLHSFFPYGKSIGMRFFVPRATYGHEGIASPSSRQRRICEGFPSTKKALPQTTRAAHNHKTTLVYQHNATYIHHEPSIQTPHRHQRDGRHDDVGRPRSLFECFDRPPHQVLGRGLPGWPNHWPQVCHVPQRLQGLVDRRFICLGRVRLGQV